MDTRASPCPWVVVTGLDGSGKSGLARRLAAARPDAFLFRLPYHDFVHPSLRRSGCGTPFGDPHTDRLIFAADARLANYRIRDWRRQHDWLVSQRGWVDNFIFGAVQHISYEQTDALLRPADLERATAIVFLVADPAVAFSRIRHDPNADKYETIEFLEVQHQETHRFHDSLRARLPLLTPFAGIPTLLIDTTRLSEDEAYAQAERFVSESIPLKRGQD